MWTRLKTGGIEIDRVNFWLTSYCNQYCPDCCVNAPNYKNPKHYDIDYIKNASRFFYGIDNLRITGGEPTMHPDFGTIVPMLKEMFGCRLLTLATNGYMVIKHQNVLHHFDDIVCTLYSHNRKEVEFLRKNGFIKRNTRSDRPVEHVPVTKRVSNPVPCERANQAVAYVEGLVYPCCIAPDFLGGKGIPLSDNWRKEILTVDLPCENCFFAINKWRKLIRKYTRKRYKPINDL